MGNPNLHAAGPLPMVAIGGGAGRGNRHVQSAANTPVGNLWLGVANRFGSRMESFGVSNGTRGALVQSNAVVRLRAETAVLLRTCCSSSCSAWTRWRAADDAPPLVEAVKAGDQAAIRRLARSRTGGEHAGSRWHHRAALGRSRRRCRDRASAAAGWRQAPTPRTGTASRRWRWRRSIATPPIVGALLEAGADASARLAEGPDDPDGRGASRQP